MWVVEVTWQPPVCCCPSPGMDGAEKDIRWWSTPNMVMGIEARLGISEQAQSARLSCVLDSEFLILIESSFRAHFPITEGISRDLHIPKPVSPGWEPWEGSGSLGVQFLAVLP